MAENKERDKLSFPWQIGLLVVFYSIIVIMPFLHDKNSQFYLFQNSNSIFGGKGFAALSNSYFKNSFIFLSVLPPLAVLLKFILNNKGYPFLASLQSFLFFIASFTLMIYTMFSITIQIDIYKLDWGFYFCQMIFLVFIFNDFRFLSANIRQRNHHLDCKK